MIIDVKSVSPEILKHIISKLPQGRAKQKYETLLYDKIGAPLGGVRCEDAPALYFLGEIMALRRRTAKELREIHEAKLRFPGMRIIQDPI